MPFYDPLIQPIRRAMAVSQEEATRWQRTVQFSAQLGRHCYQQLWKDNAPQMAAALTYRTIFGLVPLFVLALLVFRAFGGFEDLGGKVETQIVHYLGIGSIAVQEEGEADAPPILDDGAPANGEAPLTPPSGGGAPPAATTQPALPAETQPGGVPITDPSPAPEEAQTAPSTQPDTPQISVQSIINDLEDRIAEVSFTSIGIVGLVLLIWAAIGLVATVEDVFNQVFVAPHGRSWTMRVVIYWAVITLGPVLIGLSLWLTGQVLAWIEDVGAYLPGFAEWTLDALSRLAAFFATWLLMTLLYVLLPNTSVKLRSAVIGALVAAVLWEVAKWGFQLYLTNAVGYSALYGTLGLIPLFLFWVYLTWLIVLFGLELTYALQTMRGRNDGFERKPETGELLLDPRWLVPMMATVASAFDRGGSVTSNALADRLSLSSPAVTLLAQKLTDAGLLHQLPGGEEEQTRYTLARPPGRITVASLLELGQSWGMDAQATRRAPAHELVEQLGRAQHEAAAQLTLADVVERGDSDEAASPQR